MTNGPAEVQIRDSEDDLLLPMRDECTYPGCRQPEAEHVGWVKGGPSHDFRAPQRMPRPERVASSSIETQWACTHCGALCMVEGVADCEWMECDQCGRESYVVH